MADNVTITQGAGTTIATDDIGGVQFQRVKVALGADGTAVDAVAGAGTVGTGVQRMTLASDDVLVAMFKAEDAASADADKGLPILAVRKSAAANTSGTDGDYEMLQMLAGRLYVRGEPRMFSATASAMTRPANTTAYTANDAVSNNATAGSVTAISFTVSDTNDDPISLERIRLLSTDTGIAGKTFRVWLFNSDPTASSGVGGGDNAAWSQKQAGFIGTMSNAATTGSNSTFRTFSDGTGGVLTPDEGTRIITNPVSGAKTIFALIQTLDAFTPSANSTTFTLTLEGIQGRA